MTSTSITTVGGLVVVTQVIPKEETSIQLQSAAATEQPPPPATRPPPPAPTSRAKMDDMAGTFLRGEPQALGIVQILIGLLCILFSVTAIFSEILILHALFGLAIAFVLSGSLAAAAGRQTSVSLVWASLVSNVISVMVGLAGVICVCWLLAAGPPSEQLCDLREFRDPVLCSRKVWSLDNILYGLRGFLLVLLVLQVCVSVTVCVFSGKAIRRHGHYNALMVNDRCGSDVSLLDGEETQPPNSP